ncbi:MAG: hypothetical protein MK102_00525 [Fuerstiella sp.]|nr:hypothetical protein [Fuerstiella sp.]
MTASCLLITVAGELDRLFITIDAKGLLSPAVTRPQAVREDEDDVRSKRSPYR